MQLEFRSRKGSDVRVTTSKGGHTAIIGREWRSLPVLMHDAAYTAGCESREVDGGATKQPPPATETEKKVVEGIKAMLARTQKGDFSKEGLPDTRALSKVCGFEVSQEQSDAAWGTVKTQAEE